MCQVNILIVLYVGTLNSRCYNEYKLKQNKNTVALTTVFENVSTRYITNVSTRHVTNVSTRYVTNVKKEGWLDRKIFFK